MFNYRYDAISMQPNSGAQGICRITNNTFYHKSRNQENRNTRLIPESAHGTNPASAQMVGYTAIPVNLYQMEILIW